MTMFSHTPGPWRSVTGRDPSQHALVIKVRMIHERRVNAELERQVDVVAHTLIRQMESK